MRRLEFIGTVKDQVASEMVIPGRDNLFLKPDDWPTELAPGILSIEIGRFTEAFNEIDKSEGLERLDTGKFRPALVIPQRKIAGSVLARDSDLPMGAMSASFPRR
jgi:hypothetical protein